MTLASGRTIKRWAFRIFVLLLLGAIVNVAVIGVLWFWGERPERGTWEALDRWESRSSTAQDIATWERWARSGWPIAPKRIVHQSKFGMHFRLMAGTVNDFDPTDLSTDEWVEKATKRDSFRVDAVEVGWPPTCLGVDYATESVGHPPVSSTRLGGWRLGRVWIPNQPAVVAILLNAAFYAFILWLLFAAPFALRRRLRVERGLCPTCAYDLRGRGSASQTCPECGTLVKPREAAS